MAPLGRPGGELGSAREPVRIPMAFFIDFRWFGGSIFGAFYILGYIFRAFSCYLHYFFGIDFRIDFSIDFTWFLGCPRRPVWIR